MILRRYGETVQSVDPHFDFRAMNEVGFRRNHRLSIPAGEFEETHEKKEERSLDATSEGPVQDEEEAALLEELERRLRELEESLDEDEVLVVENTTEDYPKTRDVKKNVIVEGENRLYFRWRIDPPLRVGVYRRTDGA